MPRKIQKNTAPTTPHEALREVVRTWLHPATVDVDYAVRNMLSRLDRMGYVVSSKVAVVEPTDAP